MATTLVAVPSDHAVAQQKKSPAAVIRKQDRNGDGRLSRDEWRGPADRFDKLDKNHDGVLTRAELQAKGQAKGKANSKARAKSGSSKSGCSFANHFGGAMRMVACK